MRRISAPLTTEIHPCVGVGTRSRSTRNLFDVLETLQAPVTLQERAIDRAMFFADQPVTEGHLHNLVAELLGDIEAIKTRAKWRIRRNQILEIDVDEHGGLTSGATSHESLYADRVFAFFLNLGRLSELFNSLRGSARFILDEEISPAYPKENTKMSEIAHAKSWPDLTLGLYDHLRR